MQQTFEKSKRNLFRYIEIGLQYLGMENNNTPQVLRNKFRSAAAEVLIICRELCLGSHMKDLRECDPDTDEGRAHITGYSRNILEQIETKRRNLAAASKPTALVTRRIDRMNVILSDLDEAQRIKLV